MAKKRAAAKRNPTPRRQRKATVKFTGPKGEVLFEGSDREFQEAAQRAGRVNTIKSNGDRPESVEVAPEKVTIGEAMRLAVEELGEVTIDDTFAPSQLRQLAECYEDVTRRRVAFNEKNDEAKTAKKSLESATELLLEKVRAFTHLTPLPLFDPVSADSDREHMLAGGDEIAH